MRRVALVAGVAALLGLAAPSPAPALDRGEMAIGVGQTVGAEFPPIAVPMPLLDLSYSPAFCTDTPWCDVVHVKVSVPPHPEEHRLTVTLEWRADASLSAAGHCAVYLWDDPAGTYELRTANCEGTSATLDFVPIKRDYQLVVRNFTSLQNSGYELRLDYR